MIVTTTNAVEGRPATEYLGVVCAQSVLGVNVFKDVAAGMRNVFGGRSRSYENELGAGVAGTLEELEKQAAALSADAVLGVDIDYESVGEKMLMVSASGTAVRLT
ncbi:MAG TPA: YbjQ family protein [Nocardioidaceae bacterium]